MVNSAAVSWIRSASALTMAQGDRRPFGVRVGKATDDIRISDTGYRVLPFGLLRAI